MASRQDQLQSYQFAVQRVVAALVTRQPDPPQPPFRRAAGAALVGLLLTVLGIGAMGAYSVLRPGTSGKWRNDRALLVERETGALFVYRDQVLHPVLNQASALLILNSPGAPTVVVARSALAGAPRGQTLGIPGAPSSLPAAGALLRGPWTVCSTPGGSVLMVGRAAARSTPMGDKGMLVSGPGAQTYLLWHGHKHLVRQPGAVLPALVWSARPQTAVAQAFLHAVPSGSDLVTPVVPGRGTVVAEGKVGQLYGATANGHTDTFLVTTDGLVSVTPLQSALLLAAPETASVQPGGQLTALSGRELGLLTGGRATLPFTSDGGGEGALPAVPPELLDAEPRVACTNGEISTAAEASDLTGTLRTAAATDSGAVLADQVSVRPGGGALVRTETGVLALVTDLGRRHVVPDRATLDALGFAGQEPVAVPSQVLALLPAGPALDPAAAILPQ